MSSFCLISFHHRTRNAIRGFHVKSFRLYCLIVVIVANASDDRFSTSFDCIGFSFVQCFLCRRRVHVWSFLYPVMKAHRIVFNYNLHHRNDHNSCFFPLSVVHYVYDAHHFDLYALINFAILFNFHRFHLHQQRASILSTQKSKILKENTLFKINDEKRP